MRRMQRHSWIVVTVAVACGGVTRGGGSAGWWRLRGPPHFGWQWPDGAGCHWRRGGRRCGNSGRRKRTSRVPAQHLKLRSVVWGGFRLRISSLWRHLQSDDVYLFRETGISIRTRLNQYNTDFMRAFALRPSNGVECNCNVPSGGCCSSGKCESCSGPEMGLGSVDAALDAPAE
jgi:hypothetical protein